MAELALLGTTVLDLTTGTDGPFATKFLADLGARVIKVEPPGGDPARRAGPFPGDVQDPERSALFLYLNANKEGITIDLETPAGRHLLRSLAVRSDVLVENFVPGAMEAWGLAYRHLEEIRPDLVYASITPFGQTGPYARYRAPDIVRQAFAAWMVQGGWPEREPLKSGADLSYYIAGVCGAAAILAALHHRNATGTGQHVDVSAMEAFITCAGQEIYRASQSPDAWFRRIGHKGLPFGIFPCRDGWIGINILGQSNWVTFCEWAEMTDLLDDPRYSRLTALHRPGRGEELTGRVTEWARKHERDWLLVEGQRRRIATAAVPTLEETISLPQHLGRGFIATVDHPAGRYHQPGAPFRLAASPWSIRKVAPRLGEDNSPVLGALDGQ